MRKQTPSFVLELPLKTSPKEEKELLSRFESARKLYNATLGEAKKRVMLIKQSKLFQKARKLPKNDKNRNHLFKLAREKQDFSEYSLYGYVVKLRHSFSNNLDVHTAQRLASRAFHAAEKMLYGTARKVRFKGFNQLNSVESSDNASGIRWRDNSVVWNHLVLKPIIYTKDEVICYGLQKRIKYCRIVRKVIRKKDRFYVQLVLEGKPFEKKKNELGQGVVAFDFGPSTVAIVSQDEEGFHAKLLQFCSELKSREKEIHNLQRKIDRQKRQSNSQNYLPNGKIQKGRHSWKKSTRQKENEKQLRNLHQIVSSHRKSLQGKLINETLRMGNVFKTEKVSRKWLQKNFGKSVGMRSPGMFVSELRRKAESADGTFLEFPTITTKLSQTCVCGRQHKKLLSERVHVCECGVHAQRDLFSAFLALYVEKQDGDEDKYTLHADQAQKAWSSADTPLQIAWGVALQSTTEGLVPSSFGRIHPRGQSGSSAKKEIVKFEIRDVVSTCPWSGESQKENKTVPLEPTGF